MMNEKLKAIIDNFEIEGEFLSGERYGEGHINDTYLVCSSNLGQTKKYILQRINSNLFKDIAALMRNIYLVTQFNRKKVMERGGDPDREGLTVILTKNKETFYKQGNDYYRVYLFIDNATSYQVVEKPSDFYEAAVAFGNFANLLSEFDASELYEVLPDFHNTVVRYDNFINAVKADVCDRAKLVEKEIEWVKKHEFLKNKIVDLLSGGKMPLRVTHNDTKFNNVMIDDATGKAIAVIDLDTMMPGSLCYDFGDSIRFGCNPVAEDERDLGKVNFQISLFEEFTRGYLSAVGKSITNLERDNLAMGAMVMTFECGIRFLTDYLSGDTYFKTHRDGQNLDRARTQFKLVDDMEKQYSDMIKIVEKY